MHRPASQVVRHGAVGEGVGGRVAALPGGGVGGAEADGGGGHQEAAGGVRGRGGLPRRLLV